MALPAAAPAKTDIELSSNPYGRPAGEAWRLEITMLGYRARDLAAARPTLTIHGPEGEERLFVARPTANPRVWGLRVVFPSAGEWRYTIRDGLPRGDAPPFFVGADHDFGPTRIAEARSASEPSSGVGPSAATPGGGSDDGPGTHLIVGGSALAALALALAWARYRRPLVGR